MKLKMNSEMFYQEVFTPILETTYNHFRKESMDLYAKIRYMESNKILTTNLDLEAGVAYMKEFGDVTRKLQTLFGTYELFISNLGEELVEVIKQIPENSYQLWEYEKVMAEHLISFGIPVSKFIDYEIIDYSFSIYCDRTDMLKRFAPTINSDIQNLIKFLNF